MAHFLKYCLSCLQNIGQTHCVSQHINEEKKRKQSRAPVINLYKNFMPTFLKITLFFQTSLSNVLFRSSLQTDCQKIGIFLLRFWNIVSKGTLIGDFEVLTPVSLCSGLINSQNSNYFLNIIDKYFLFSLSLIVLLFLWCNTPKKILTVAQNAFKSEEESRRSI